MSGAGRLKRRGNRTAESARLEQSKGAKGLGVYVQAGSRDKAMIGWRYNQGSGDAWMRTVFNRVVAEELSKMEHTGQVRVLVEGGRWVVGEGERPKGWERWGVGEPGVGEGEK